MNNKTSVNIVDAVLIAVLEPCVMWCLMSSFGINANLTVLFMFSAVFSAVFSLLCIYIKRTCRFVAACAVSATAYIFVAALESPFVIAQLEYVINAVLEEYSQYLPVPKSIAIGSAAASDATMLLVLAEIFLIFISALFVLRIRASYAAVLISLAFTVPCFILVNTCPATVPLFAVIAASATLITVSPLQRQSVKRNGIISAAAFLVVIAILIGVYSFNPIESFTREKWQDDLLVDFRTRTGIDGALRGDNFDLIKRISDRSDKLRSVEDLSLADAFEQTHELVMQVYAENPGTIYLRGTAYASYEDNKWAILSDKQLRDFPDGIDIFDMTQLDSSEDNIRIVTRQSNPLVYTPYYLIDTPGGMTPLADICIFNERNERKYEFPVYSYGYGNSFAASFQPDYQRYSEFVYKNYLQISDELAAELRDVGDMMGFDGIESDEQLIDEIIGYVSSSAEYSLNTPRVPEGKDIASWLLKESETGYCIHFATAACMMLRAYGVPARYVTGYCVEKLPEEEYVSVTSDNAHAWVECYFNGYGWVPFEATPINLDDFHSHIDDIDVEDESETQSDEAEETATQVSDDSEAAEVGGHGGEDGTYLPVYLLLLIAAAALAAALRVLIVRAIRRTRFEKGGRNGRAIYIYRYIVRCAKRAKAEIPDRISDIGAKARFSRHTVSADEVKTLLDYADSVRKALYGGSNPIKRLFYRVVLVL